MEVSAVKIHDLTDDGEIAYVALSEEGCNDEIDASVFRKVMESGMTVQQGMVIGEPVFD